MTCWKQVRCDLAQQQRQDTAAECITGSNKHGVAADMNGTNGNCSCHKQSRCNRLTCYRNGNSSGSNHRQALPLFITIAVLALATTPINAAVVRRSIAETTTDLHFTTPNTPLEAAVEIDTTTVDTPHLADNHTAVVDVQHNVTVAIAVNEAETSTVSSGTVRHDNPITVLSRPQDVNNEIAQVVSEEATTNLRVNPKFDYAETVLDENLEDSIRNSVRNEIEFEQDIVAAQVQHLQNVTDEEVRRKLRDEVKLIQSALQESSTKSSAAIDVLAELTSTSPDTVHEQLSTTESTTLEHSKTANYDLSVLFPLQAEEAVSTVKSFVDNQRGARNLNVNGNENGGILNDSGVTNMQLAEEEGMQNIEEDKVEAQEGLLAADESSIQTKLNRISESALYSHEANEIDEEGLKEQKEFSNGPDHQKMEDDTEPEGKNIKASTEVHSVNAEVNNVDNEDTQESVKSHEATSSSLLDENENTSREQATVENENANAETTEKSFSAADVDETEITPAAADESSLSIVLNENLTATEPSMVLAEDLPVDLLHLDESDALANEEVGTTVEPESVKSVHIVIKKQGVELEEGALESVTVESMEETTDSVDIVKEELLDEEETTAKPAVTLENVVDGENEQSVQNDDAAKESSLELENNANEQAVSEPVESPTGHVEEDTQNNSEDDKLNEDNNRIDEVEQEAQELENKSNLTTSEESTQSDGKEDTLNGMQHLIEINIDIGSQTEKSTTNEDGQIPSVDKLAEESTILQETEPDNEITQSGSTTESIILQESVDNETNLQNKITPKHISLLSTTYIPNGEISPISTSTTEGQSTTLKDSQVNDDDDNSTDDPDIVPLLVGVSAGQGDVTASTKGSRSINTQTHHTMLLTQLDDTMAATLFETFPPHNAGRTLNDHMAAESNGGIGKPLPTRSINDVTSASVFSRSGLIIVICSSIALMFLLVSVVAFFISFQRQHGTLDIEMQEQRCGKDDLDEEDEEVGTCTKLLEIELPKSTIVAASCEELEECL
ncbi:uncharacterized protein LOC120772486 [Bactrocera tryoni]|uniref:uncharacterized protein LOC120772486 n=1 Tax=Bactrocera tryoni TaxID=59916 RepID=UPI001A971694|nr:uncharacterized protein LOC120772486 [Bactrocera tryoni]